MNVFAAWRKGHVAKAGFQFCCCLLLPLCLHALCFRHPLPQPVPLPVRPKHRKGCTCWFQCEPHLQATDNFINDDQWKWLTYIYIYISSFSCWSGVIWIWSWNLTKQCLSLLSRLWALKFYIIVLLDIHSLFHGIGWGRGHLFSSWLNRVGWGSFIFIMIIVDSNDTMY